VTPAPLRTQLRDAIGRAWDRAVAEGSVPPWPADAERPAIEVQRPADPAHGDFASNLALKLARP
jgi:arginyl-tRNA synthetase